VNMPRFHAAVGGCLLTLLPITAWSAESGPVPPAVAFSPDERVVSIDYAKGRWRFFRPVASPWKYEAVGRRYWVAPDGSDSGEGTESNPLRTLAKAVELAQAGDIVYAKAGMYVEHLVVRKSGREDAPIILSCAPGALGRAKVTPSSNYVRQNPSGAVITLQGARYVWINGLVIEGPLGRPEAPAAETYGANGITWAGKAGHGCRATNNVVYGQVHCGLKEMGHGGTGILMEANLIFANGTRSTDHGIYCPADDLTIRGNIIFDNAGYGIHSYTHPKRQIITHNLCVNNRAAGIILAGSQNQALHNTCVANGIGMFYFRGGCTDNLVQNNIFAFNRTDCGYDNGGGRYGDPARNRDDYNCYFPGKPHAQIHAGEHEVLADPRFVDAAAGDFRLRPDSPCVGKGIGPAVRGAATNLGALPVALP